MRKSGRKRKIDTQVEETKRNFWEENKFNSTFREEINQHRKAKVSFAIRQDVKAFRWVGSKAHEDGESNAAGIDNKGRSQ